MKSKRKKITKEILDYQPEAVAIGEKSVSYKVRWVLYIIIFFFIIIIGGSLIFHIDRIVVAEGKLLTTSPTIVVQPLNTAVIRSIDVEAGDIVHKNQQLATLDSTFTSADLSQLKKQKIALEANLRRLDAELHNTPFIPLPVEGEDGLLQKQFYLQRQRILAKTKQLHEDQKAVLEAKRKVNLTQRTASKRNLKVLRDVEGTSTMIPQMGPEYRLQLLEAQRARYLAEDEIEHLKMEEELINSELAQIESEWQQFLEERTGQIMEEKIQLHRENDKIQEELNKAERLQELVVLRAPQSGVVLNMAQRSVGSILQQAEPFVTLVPISSTIEVEVQVQAKDIARIRLKDAVRVKLDAYPFQKHGTLQGEVRVISEDAFSFLQNETLHKTENTEKTSAFYKTRIKLLSHDLHNVPDGFKLIPGMTVRSEIKIGKRKIISYFLYPVIRALDESLREP